MILANDFLEYLLNTERDLAARVRDRYDMYLKSLPVPQLADGKIVIDGRYMIDSHYSAVIVIYFVMPFRVSRQTAASR